MNISIGYRVTRCVGDCLAGVGFPVRCRIVVNENAIPKIGDIVLCEDEWGSLSLKVKMLTAIDGKRTVSTRYIDKSKDFSFNTPHIYGVVEKCLSENEDTIIWESVDWRTNFEK